MRAILGVHTPDGAPNVILDGFVGPAHVSAVIGMKPYEEFTKKAWEEKSGIGVATKCDFCLDRIADSREPACVEACPANARIFGDLDDPNSEVSILIKKERGQVLNPEFENKPKVYYLFPR